MHSLTQSDWAEGLHLTVTGLNRDQRKQARNVVEAAGGRYVVSNGCLIALSVHSSRCLSAELCSRRLAGLQISLLCIHTVTMTAGTHQTLARDALI